MKNLPDAVTHVVGDGVYDSMNLHRAVEAGGRTFKLCCKGCVKKVKKSPETFVKKLDAAVIAQQSKNYPLKTCPISKQKLGAKGKPIEIVLDNQLVKLCCKGCVKKAGKNKAEIVAKIQTLAYEQQTNSYARKNCPVSGKKLGSMGKAFELMHGTTLVKLCCKGCLKKFQASPTQYLAKPGMRKPASRPSK